MTKPWNERLWEHIDASAGEDGCWPCDYGCASGGYPVMTIALAHRTYKQRKVHRLVYELVNGPIPKDRLVLHVCKQVKCCNPKHLVLGERPAVLGALMQKKGDAWLQAWYIACSPTPAVEVQPAGDYEQASIS